MTTSKFGSIEIRKALAIEAIRAMTVDGNPPSFRFYRDNREEWMPASRVVVTWFGKWGTAVAAAMDADVTTDDELDAASVAELAEVERMRLLSDGWFLGCHIVWNPATKREYTFYDTTSRRWVRTHAYTGAMTV